MMIFVCLKYLGSLSLVDKAAGKHQSSRPIRDGGNTHESIHAFVQSKFSLLYTSILNVR